MTLLLLFNQGAPPFGPLPDDHPFYQMVGRVAAEWAHLEHVLDEAIWDLAGLTPASGSCITAELRGTYARYKAILTLGTVAGISQKTLDKAEVQMGKSNGLGEKRNRLVHDPWFVESSSKAAGQFASMIWKKRQYGFLPIDNAEFKKTISDIQKARNDANALRATLLTELKASREKRQ
jgi:hypothetical protein